MDRLSWPDDAPIVELIFHQESLLSDDVQLMMDWTDEIARVPASVWKKAKAILDSMDKTLWAYCECDKAVRFVRLFGFQPVGEVDGLTLMRKLPCKH